MKRFEQFLESANTGSDFEVLPKLVRAIAHTTIGTYEVYVQAVRKTSLNKAYSPGSHSKIEHFASLAVLEYLKDAKKRPANMPFEDVEVDEFKAGETKEVDKQASGASPISTHHIKAFIKKTSSKPATKKKAGGSSWR